MPQELVFVTANGDARIRSRDRRTIRRQCMLRRNKQPGSRRTKREIARHMAEVSRPQASVAGDWAVFTFPGDLGPSSQGLLHKYYLRNPIRDLLFPFKHYGYNIAFAEDPQQCFRLLCSEELYFRVILLLTSASHDYVHGRPPSQMAVHHVRNTIASLNSRLCLRDSYRDDIVLYVVGALAFVAVIFGEHGTAETHRAGLSEILRLRGGLATVDSNPVVQFAIDRLNFASSIMLKSPTPLYSRYFWERPTFPTTIEESHAREKMIDLDGIIDPEVASIFQCLQYTTLLFNSHLHDKTGPMDGVLLRQSLGYIHCSLLYHHQGEARKLFYPLTRCIHLAMVAFVGTTFRLPDVAPPPYDMNDLKEALQSIDGPSLSYSETNRVDHPHDHHHMTRASLTIWATMVLLLSNNKTYQVAGDPGDLKVALNRVQELSWGELRPRLGQVAWIHAMHDQPGESALEQIRRSRLADQGADILLATHPG